MESFIGTKISNLDILAVNSFIMTVCCTRVSFVNFGNLFKTIQHAMARCETASGYVL